MNTNAATMTMRRERRGAPAGRRCRARGSANRNGSAFAAHSTIEYATHAADDAPRLERAEPVEESRSQRATARAATAAGSRATTRVEQRSARARLRWRPGAPRSPSTATAPRTQRRAPQVGRQRIDAATATRKQPTTSSMSNRRSSTTLDSAGLMPKPDPACEQRRPDDLAQAQRQHGRGARSRSPSPRTPARAARAATGASRSAPALRAEQDGEHATTPRTRGTHGMLADPRTRPTASQSVPRVANQRQASETAMPRVRRIVFRRRSSLGARHYRRSSGETKGRHVAGRGTPARPARPPRRAPARPVPLPAGIESQAEAQHHHQERERSEPAARHRASRPRERRRRIAGPLDARSRAPRAASSHTVTTRTTCCGR